MPVYAPSHPSFSHPPLPSPLLHLALCGPLSLSPPVPCPFIIAPSLPLVSRLAGSRWRGREGGRDVGRDGWREGWKTGGGCVCCHLFLCSYHHSADQDLAQIVKLSFLPIPFS